jgi:hypothetical protein
LPAYQLERRADIFFALYLDKILEKHRGAKIDLIIPEFPVRLGSLPNYNHLDNRSYKIDYLVYAAKPQRVFLIELKTDQRSLRGKQDLYLKQAAKIKVSGLMEGLQEIYKATIQKIKYNNLLNKLETVGWIERTGTDIIIKAPDITPEVLYIQPINKENKDNTISFDNIISVLSETDDPIAPRFAISLEKWKRDVNQK